jgi:hypothetical protein
MKNFSTFLTIKEMETKTTLRFHHIPCKMVVIKNTNNNKCWQGCGGRKRNSHTLLMGMQISTTTKENSIEAPQKTKNRTPI